jgi:hypothetical protein
MYKRIGTGEVPCDVVHRQCLRQDSGSPWQKSPAHFYLTLPGPIAGTNRPHRVRTPGKLSKRLGQEAQHLRLEGLISHREHVISPRDVERSSRWQ